MKRVVSVFVAMFFCINLILPLSVFAENESQIGSTYTIHTTASGDVWNGTDTINRYYEVLYAWGNDTDSPTRTNKDSHKSYWLGNNGGSDYAPIFRYKIPEYAANEVVKSAKLKITVSSISKMSADMTVCAYTDFLSSAYGSQMSIKDTYPKVTSNLAGQTFVSKNTTASDTVIEIDVTTCVKNKIGNVDFLLSVPGLNDKANYLIIHAAQATESAKRPQLEIITEEGVVYNRILSEDAENVNVNDYVAHIQFVYPMNPDTLTEENITIQPDNIPVKRINFSPDFTAVKLAVGSNLLYDTQYTVRFNGDVVSANGARLEEGVCFKFTTAVSEDNSAARIVTGFPENGDKNIGAIKCLTLEFNKEMYLPDITKDDFILEKTGSEEKLAVEKVNIHSDNKRMFIYLAEALSYNSQYTLKVSGMRDLDENDFIGEISFSTARASVVITDISENGVSENTVKTIYTTLSGAEKTENDVIEDLYETATYWENTAAAKESNNNDGYSVLPVGADVSGENIRYWGSALRFPMPQISDGQIINSAKLVFTVNNVTSHTASMELNAYGSFTDINFGENISKFGKTYAQITSIDSAGSVTVPVGTLKGEKLEIDVTDYIKSLSNEKTSADFVICVPSLAEANLIKLYSGHSASVESRPALVVETAPDVSLNGTARVTLENVTNTPQSVVLLSALYSGEGKLKDFSANNKVEIGTGEDSTTVVHMNNFKDREETDCVKFFGLEDYGTLMPLLNTAIGSVDTQFYPGYTRKAVTLSYDDGPRASDTMMMRGLNEKGIRATFNIIAGWRKTGTVQEEFDEALLAGNHEVANHGMNHQSNLGKLSLEEAIADLKDGENRLEYLYDCDVRGLAYPYGKPTSNFTQISDYLVSAGNVYARCSSNNSFEIPSDFMQWDFTSHHSGLYSDADLANKFFNQLSDDGKLKVLAIWGHAWNFDADEEEGIEETWTTIFEPFTDTLSEKIQAGEVWNCTKIEFVDYINAINGLVINKDSIYNPGNVDVYVKINGERRIVPAGGCIY